MSSGVMDKPKKSMNTQMGPCGIICQGCDLGSGSVAETAIKLKDYIQSVGVPQWAPALPGGADIDFKRFNKNLEWLSVNTRCVGCEQGGGPPDCAVRLCSRERGHTLCSDCQDLDLCDKYEWLGETGNQLKKVLARSKGKTKEEIIKASRG